MNDKPPFAIRFFGIFRRKQPLPYEPWEAAHQREIAEGMTLLKARRRKENEEQRLKNVVAMWPIGVGLILAAFAPVLQTAAQAIGPWAMTIVFPFVVLAERPEMKVGPITYLLPSIMLYAQFPVEGLLAKIILRRPVLPFSVMMQVLLFHFLGIAEVWLLNGVGQQVMGR